MNYKRNYFARRHSAVYILTLTILALRKGLINTLLYRAYNTCSNYSSFQQEINYLKTIWQKNSFPLFFIDKCVQKFLNKLFIKRDHQNLKSTKKEVLITLEYLGKRSLQVKKQLKDIFRSCQNNVKLNVVFKSSKRIKILSVSKTYYLNILTQKFYICKTKWHLLVRQYGHLSLSVFTEKALKYTAKDAKAIRKYCHQNKHRYSADNFEIVVND